MTKTQLEQRVRALESQVAWLRARWKKPWVHKCPGGEKISGSFADDPAAFEEAMRLGREWRESFRPKKRSSQKKPRKAKSSDGRS